MNCIICGCTERSACVHPDAGPCSWASYMPPICSHCVDIDIFRECERPLKNLQNVRPLFNNELSEIFKKFALIVAFKEAKGTCVYLTLSQGAKDDFDRLITNWYPRGIKGDDGGWLIDLEQHIMLDPFWDNKTKGKQAL